LQSVIDRWICDSDDAPPYAGILEDLPLQIPARVFLRGNPIHTRDCDAAARNSATEKILERIPPYH